MKFKIIASIVVIIVVLLAIIIGTAAKNSESGEPQTEQVNQ
jgi:hypothetical protein